ncbi:MAG: YceD family protein [Synechococcus sp.]
MIEGLEPVPLQELRALGDPKAWTVEGQLEDLPTLTPVRGRMSAEHRGNVLSVEGELSAIVTLTCDRCLGQFNQQLTCQPNELIWLGDAPPTDGDLQESEDIAAMDGLVESLDPRGLFDPQQWVFEQLNLLLPVVNHCGPHCPGPGVPLRETSDTSDQPPVDPRWDALRRLNPS